MTEKRNDDVVLSVKDLHVNFYTNQRCNKVLRGVSFDIRRGRTLCVVGESGCGKSVTANSILRLLPDLSRIESGSITYYREDGSEVRLDQLKKNGKEMRSLRDLLGLVPHERLHLGTAHQRPDSGAARLVARVTHRTSPPLLSRSSGFPAGCWHP